MVEREAFVNDRVGRYFKVNDYNCVRTNLLTPGEHFGIEIGTQIMAAAAGMHGAGKYRVQCGLVEGTLMFPGLLGTEKGVGEEDIIAACYDFGEPYEEMFSSLQCRDLRPGGFNDDPPQLCPDLACNSTIFSLGFVEERLKTWQCDSAVAED